MPCVLSISSNLSTGPGIEPSREAYRFDVREETASTLGAVPVMESLSPLRASRYSFAVIGISPAGTSWPPGREPVARAGALECSGPLVWSAVSARPHNPNQQVRNQIEQHECCPFPLAFLLPLHLPLSGRSLRRATLEGIVELGHALHRSHHGVLRLLNHKSLGSPLRRRPP